MDRAGHARGRSFREDSLEELRVFLTTRLEEATARADLAERRLAELEARAPGPPPGERL